MDIPFFNYPALFQEGREEYLAAITDVLDRGAFIMQEELAAFEQKLAQFNGVPYALGVADGTMALTIALQLAGARRDTEVILPSHTFVATAAAVHHAGATPVLCDCGPDHMMDVESARAMVTPRTKAIMPVQLNGRTVDMDAVLDLAEEYDLAIVEDSCQALGAKYKGRYAGTFGVAGSFSFYPAKSLGCFGDGGGLIFKDEAAYTTAKELRDHGRGADGLVHKFGHNARLDNIQAAILSIKLARLDKALARRRQIAGIYHDALQRFSNTGALLLPPGPDDDRDRFDTFQNYEIEADDRDALAAHLATDGIGTIRQWGGYVISQFKDLGLRAQAPYAEAMTERFLMLPMHHLLCDDEVVHIIGSVERFYSQRGRRA